MKPVKSRFHLDFPVSLQEEFAGVVARVVVELLVELAETQSLPISASISGYSLHPTFQT